MSPGFTLLVSGRVTTKSYRFSVNWCRIMPEKGKINPKGLAFYKDLVAELRSAGIEPMVTLYHWDLPVWADKEGGWKNQKIVDWYLEYVRAVVDDLSDEVHFWMTFNEPQVFIMSAYVLGNFAPFQHAIFSFKNCLRNMLLAHGKAVSLIRKIAKTPPKIGLAMASTNYIPDSEEEACLRDAAEKSFTSQVGEGSNGMYMDPVALGKASKMLRRKLSAEDLKIISAPIDFIGVNVYQPANPLFKDTKYSAEGKPKSALGWVIDGRCLYWTIRQYYERYHLPILVTENGMANPDEVGRDGKVHDDMRETFLKDFISAMKCAVDEGIPVVGYQHWSVMDNFEWCSAYGPRFGLIHVDYQTQKRTIKESARYYARIIASNGEDL